ncbi:MAG: hypothetical protein GQ526_07115 [Ardenticatenales bacterium]|nr:hypothetical protein [Ardenticatenales bacterium]
MGESCPVKAREGGGIGPRAGGRLGAQIEEYQPAAHVGKDALQGQIEDPIDVLLRIRRGPDQVELLDELAYAGARAHEKDSREVAPGRMVDPDVFGNGAAVGGDQNMARALNPGQEVGIRGTFPWRQRLPNGEDLHPGINPQQLTLHCMGNVLIQQKAGASHC